MEGDLGASSRGASSGFVSGLSCGWGRSEHKHKHRHRLCERNMETEEELQDEEEEDGMHRELLSGSKTQSGLNFGQVEGRRKGGKGPGSILSKDSPWLRQNGSIPFSAATSSSSCSSAERYKNTSLTSLGLGSTHLSSFGGGWGGLGHNWATFGSLGSPGFGTLNSSWRGFSGDKHVGRMAASEGKDEDGEDDVDDSHLYAPKHTNLFTSAAMSAVGRGLRSRLSSRIPGSGEKSWRRDEPAWTERREAGENALMI